MNKIYIALLLIAPLLGYSKQAPPSDEQMIDIFQKNRGVFEKLLNMISNDKYQIVSMTPEWSKPENIPQERKEQYYELFTKINVKQLQFYDGMASFEVWAIGWAGDADYKKYEFKPYKIDNLVGSLNKLPLTQTNIVFYHRKIDEDWYLSYHHWP